MTSISEWWMWLGFLAFVLIMLFVDLFVFGGGKAHRVSTKEALSHHIVVHSGYYFQLSSMVVSC